ncbi:PREDICTED: uncharacterized protein LOC104806779 isoform X2 [Tarenaya hassleriana]|uniref:uncharacterized protein LOC104806779 isoform X2 n=1 Tax=Tarenaya hassleriana TaxID=28532 RepID=UPI00053C7EE9|nr:PREDICTED: uncharacterized protein LOC104806779 isoform X2 [Tarenaya hassleriana]
MTEQDQTFNAATECCMCGDSGLSHELLFCKTCRFRSQHRYCSNMYPNSDSYDTCNWCLGQNSDINKQRDQTNTASFKGVHVDAELKRPKRVFAAGDDGPLSPSEEAAGENGRRRRIITRGKLEEMIKLGRAKSEESSSEIRGKVILKAKFRNKAKRYKLLDEVSN